MPKPGIIVVGASAGGVEALQVLAAGLPADLDASVFVVLHIGAGINGRSQMPAILSAAGKLPAVQPTDGAQIETGRIYVAPPDCHLLVEEGSVRLSHGPKENWTRPAINPLFRSAAAAYGAGVIGVILSGTLEDGIAGLARSSGGEALRLFRTRGPRCTPACRSTQSERSMWTMSCRCPISAALSLIWCGRNAPPPSKRSR